ncbi:hypothetical protein BRADI_3g08402v3 [Brachypodium distachyon]|uniref:Uncharacterized protein n=1 Tax=Brachypodium distachyon TaxID=15368 RepID=A0A2K2CVZ7_BRADI|nr:hypothetical protein BRADI_3g08402v3 [Brachypodium distachyon]
MPVPRPFEDCRCIPGLLSSLFLLQASVKFLFFFSSFWPLTFFSFALPFSVF